MESAVLIWLLGHPNLHNQDQSGIWKRAKITRKWQFWGHTKGCNSSFWHRPLEPRVKTVRPELKLSHPLHLLLSSKLHDMINAIICLLKLCLLNMNFRMRIFIMQYFFFYLVFTACQDYFTHFEPSQSIGGVKTGDPQEKQPDRQQAKLDLSNMWHERNSNPQWWDNEQFRALMISGLNHSAKRAANNAIYFTFKSDIIFFTKKIQTMH